MIIRYRDYSFALGAASYRDDFSNDHIDTLDNAGRLVKLRANTTRRLVINAWIQGDSPADIKAKISQFEQAFSIDGGDFTATAGTTEVHAVRTADTATGLRVKAVSYPVGNGTEWVNKRTVEVTLEYEYPLTDQAAGGLNGATEFSQTLAFTGTGGPRHMIQETMDGPPIKYQLAARTRCTCVQQGSAMSRIRRLTPPAPFFPADEKEDLRQISGPDNEGRISWQYYFEKVGPFGD